MKYRTKILLLSVSLLLQAACSNQAAYNTESFSEDSPFKLKTEGETATACESVRRALLGQGYLIDLANSDEVKARKATRGEGKQNTFIEMNAVCVPETSGSTIFATGVFTTYAMKTNSSSASVGVSALGSISLPIGQSVDSLVKVSEQTIDDKDFYKRFFTAVESILGEMEAGKVSAEPVEDTADAEPTPPPAPVQQPAIWPELFPEHAEAESPPEAEVESQSGAVAEPATAVEGYAAPTTEPVITPEAYPAQVAPVVVPAAQPADVQPVVTPGAYPVQVQPAIGAEALSPQSPAVNNSAPGPDEEPLGITPITGPDEEPLGITPEPLPVQKSTTAYPTQLAPISTTAVRRTVSLPAAEQKAEPEVPKQPSPAPIEDLF